MMSVENSLNQFEQLFQPYLHLRLSAYDNAKIVVAVLASQNKTYRVVECVSSAQLDTEQAVSQHGHYLVETDFGNIGCGRANGYQEAIQLIDALQDVDLSSARELTVPVLNMQQVAFMCVETAHFDHC
ncbi:hypothetical protein [Shewanella sp. 10N.286.52.A9]|uniref:hypothetical protein n=1 Tax=Shewanella sp. 10N.286.52.A9 TaxID=3229711 RepID=UPI00354FBBFB